MCVVEGRSENCFNNYMYASNKGRSVVDYSITEHDNIHKVNRFKVETCRTSE